MPRWLAAAWALSIGGAVGVRLWVALLGANMWGYDAWGHVAYVLFLDLYRGVPWADQGWSYFHPPLHYGLGWVLAQFGSGDVLMRGLALLGSAASLGTAALAATVVRWSSPERPLLPWLAFTALAFLPVQLFMSPMPGNALTETFLTAAAVTAFIANERRARPTWQGAAGCGALMGLALLTKFGGLVALAVALSSLGLRPFFRAAWRDEWRAVLLRGAVTSAVALAIASPYYVRNLDAFGKPFVLSREFSLVGDVELRQPPGQRTWRDYVRIPFALLEDPSPRAPHMLHSVWGTVYVNVWADSFHETDVVERPALVRKRRRAWSGMAVVGLGPTALALWGAALAFADVRRGRRRPLYVPMLWLAAGAVAGFLWFTWVMPRWPGLKSSYLLALSLPFGVFVARGGEVLAARASAWQRAAAPAWIATAAFAASVLVLPGVVFPARADAPATGAVRFHFGEYDQARRIYGRLVTGSGYTVPWLENLAAVELADGQNSRARRIYARAHGLAAAPDPYRDGRLAVSTAVDGDLEEALAILDGALAENGPSELRANRGAVRAARGDTAGAESDLRDALAANPGLVPAWRNLALLLDRAGRESEALVTRARAVEAACRTPRHYPYGLGSGEILEWGVGRRWLLLVDGDGVSAALPAFYRRACDLLAAPDWQTLPVATATARATDR
jgi:tetratricopeptide (TPR) repeat protein